MRNSTKYMKKGGPVKPPKSAKYMKSGGAVKPPKSAKYMKSGGAVKGKKKDSDMTVAEARSFLKGKGYKVVKA